MPRGCWAGAGRGDSSGGEADGFGEDPRWDAVAPDAGEVAAGAEVPGEGGFEVLGELVAVGVEALGCASDGALAAPRLNATVQGRTLWERLDWETAAVIGALLGYGLGMTEHRLAFAFTGLTQRKFNRLVKDVDDYVAQRLEELAGDDEYEVYCGPGGPTDWQPSDVGVRLDGIRAERASSSD